MIWKQWNAGSSVREVASLGIGRDLAARTAAARTALALANSPALSYALPSLLRSLGLPRLFDGSA